MNVRPDIVFEDADLLVVAKPSGVYVHPSPGHETGTLAMALVAHCPGMAGVGSASRPGVVHRLDAETSGVMAFAKTPRAYLALRRLFEEHSRVQKTYLAIVHGSFAARTGTIDAPIGRKPWDAKRMAVDGADAKRAVTHWTSLAKRNGRSLVEFRIETGRTHQIRVHAAHAGCPIAGDALYGDSLRDARCRPRPSRLMLHAVTLAFPHPVTGAPLEFSVPPPADFF